MGKFLIFCRIKLKFISGYIKNVDTHHESFSSKKQVIKKVIAKKPLTNLYEMNSRSHILVILQKKCYISIPNEFGEGAVIFLLFVY